ncbi:MAG: 3'(2'),5'-bisphosphate nucleotidase CysQ [Myxococcales bacterium]|nr:3'(2'),5'-bisphosphate nucleotidase CysQ [Myxococcales bacterium]
MSDNALGTVIRLAQEAGEIIQKVAADGFDPQRKADNSPVTAADLASEAHIRAGLTKTFPEDALLCEESGLGGFVGSDRVWVVDPLDGTKAFVKQVPGYSVMIGLLVRGVPTLGVVFDPLTETTWYADDTSGAFVIHGIGATPVPVRVSERSEVDLMRLITTPSLKEEKRRFLLQTTGLMQGPVINSVGIKVGLLVEQEGDLYFSHHGLSYWDTVAPLAIAHAAGATSSLLDGSPLTYNVYEHDQEKQHSMPVLISNGRQHNAVRLRLQDAMKHLQQQVSNE